MELFREKDRLKEDWRVLEISRLSDFSLWQQRKELGFQALRMHLKLNQEEIAAAQQMPITSSADTLARTIKLIEIQSHDLNVSCRQAFFKNALPKKLYSTAFKLREIWNIAHQDNIPTLYLELILNGNYPLDLHKHKRAITMSVFGGGTIFQNKQGDEYQADDGVVTLFEDIPHRVSRLPPRKKEAHRANFVCI